MSFVEVEVLPGSWRVLSTNWGRNAAFRELNLLRRECADWLAGRVLRVVTVGGAA